MRNVKVCKYILRIIMFPALDNFIRFLLYTFDSSTFTSKCKTDIFRMFFIQNIDIYYIYLQICHFLRLTLSLYHQQNNFHNNFALNIRQDYLIKSAKISLKMHVGVCIPHGGSRVTEQALALVSPYRRLARNILEDSSIPFPLSSPSPPPPLSSLSLHLHHTVLFIMNHRLRKYSQNNAMVPKLLVITCKVNRVFDLFKAFV